MDPVFWIKLGLVGAGCFALYLVAWPIPNYVERLLKQRQITTSDPADDAFLDYFGDERGRLAAEAHRAEHLPAELEQRIAAFALAQKLTRSEALKLLIETGLATQAGDRVAAPLRHRPIMLVHRSN